MLFEDFLRRSQVDKGILERMAFNPYYRRIESGVGGTLWLEGEEFINLASNNYLGLANEPKVREAMIKALNQYGASMCGTPIVTGYAKIVSQLEEHCSRFLGLESTIIFPSCFQANNSLFQAIARQNDLIMIDHYAHASLIQGVRAVGCKIKPFLHNNLNHLKGLLEKAKGYEQIFVVTESVFSTEGSLAPFDQMIELCAQYQAVPVVDDSHGLGVIGQTGRGILEAKGLKGYQGIYTASLGKAIAGMGGLVSGPATIIDYLRYSCPGLIYSTAIPPAILGGIEMVLQIIEGEFQTLSERMWRNKRLLTETLLQGGFPLTDGEAPIISIKCGGLEDTLAWSKRLFEQKILATVFVPPSVPSNQGRIRLIAGADLGENTLQRALDIFQKIAKGSQGA